MPDRRYRLAASVVVGLLSAVIGTGPAGAQSLPIVPPGMPPGSGCVILADLAPCIIDPLPLPPLIVAGIGEGRVDVDRDVDRSRQPGSVLIR